MYYSLLHASCFVFLALACRRWLTRRRGLPLPPGPKGLPIVGNVRDLSYNGKHSWMIYADWANIYGDVMYLEVFGEPMVILNSAKSIMEIMERRSANYSDRPDMHMVNDLMKWDWDLAHMRYSDWWRLHRKTFHQYFQPRAVVAYQPIQLKATSALLRQLLDSPAGFAGHVRQHAGSVILKVAYGYDVKPVGDPYVRLADEAVKGLVQAVNPGSFLVDFLPILKYVPSWLPGASFKRKAKVWAKLSLELRDSPFELLKASIKEGRATPSFATENLDRIKSSEMLDSYSQMEEVVKNCAGIAYLAGSDTTVSVVLSCILALLLNPSVQERAQAQLVAVVGPSRLPDFDDRTQLPYLDAIISETLRWLPVTPLALPHKSLRDDVYEGYRIPAGSTVVGNAWAVLHDPEIYPDPRAFKPERFLGKELPPDPAIYSFGFGRRICPGRYLALNSAWIGISAILATYSITKALDDNGNEISPVVDCTEGTVTHPLPFKCRFVPRSPDAERLIRTGYEDST